ncbi:hypothetical protein WN943_015989 [Citrus x changshan-huyou]
MEKKVMDLCEAAKRAAVAAVWKEGVVEEARCIDALDQIKNSSITYQLLVSTQVIRHLLPMLKHPSQKIQKLAYDLISSWRDMCWDVEDVEYVAVTKKAKLVENVKVEEVTNGEERRHDSGNVPKKLISCMIKCNDCIREIVREKLYDALSKVSDEAADKVTIDLVKACDPIQVAILMESAIDPENQDFRRNVLLGHVKPETIINMSAKEMASDKIQLWNHHLDKDGALVTGHIFPVGLSREIIVSDIYECGRCGHNKISYQHSSILDDYNLTRHVTCLNCNQYWVSTNLSFGVLPI